jgi:hypothetical protein
VDYLGFKELQKFNKCITSLITDFEQAILAQVSDKWKPITLADGAFELDERKRDISTSDAKFAVRKHKPSALMQCLTSRAERQQVSLPFFILSKSFTLKKKRSSEESANRLSKRFRQANAALSHGTRSG